MELHSLHADCFRGASLNTCLALSALFLIYDCYFLVVQADGLLRALLDAGSTAYTFVSINNCGHY